VNDVEKAWQKFSVDSLLGGFYDSAAPGGITGRVRHLDLLAGRIPGWLRGGSCRNGQPLERFQAAATGFLVLRR
jgi:hypothetical protein